ncbi:PREDICTED: telomeric repeat-binding factor 2 isoform X1 [Lepidothrix coronata]|uniref:Telomeric repeat-binding factor 2 n=1 Tax=Lepidothrix coronata TaxID=321398 RepID=A0A6J0HDP5_9PASS|nr:PREDICTED: telomeric repeat-binding factor 2 isoform X1 [Lepidothrix coronata]
MAARRGRAARREQFPGPPGMAALREETVNGWVLQFYFHRAMEAYRSGRHREFRQLRDIMQALLVRPLDKEPAVAQMLRIMQLLSRIEEGENLDCTFDKESELTPLESALAVLELVHKEFSMPEKTMETVQKMVKEAAVIVCIKNKEFDKASKIVKRHMGKDPKNQKKRNEWLAVIREKNLSHPKVKNFSYKDFQQSMFEFLKIYVDDSEPLLLTVMKKTLNLEHTNEPKSLSVTPRSADGPKDQTATPEASGRAEGPTGAPESAGAAEEPEGAASPAERAAHPSVAPEAMEGGSDPAAAPEPMEVATDPAATPDHLTAEPDVLKDTPEPVNIAKEPAAVTAELPGVSTRDAERQPPGAVTSCGISVLREAFKILSDSQDSDALFTKLDETDFTFPKQLSPSVSHRTKRRQEVENQDSEISDPPEIPHKGKRLFTISKLVMETDNQSSKSSESPDSSQEPVVSSASRPRPVQKLHDQPVTTESAKSFQGRWNSSRGVEEKDSWSEEDELFLDAASVGTNNTTVFSSKKQKWTIQESEWIKQGVKKFGEGRWKAICQKYPFQNRTAVMIKDRWRTMKKQGIL